MYISWRGATLSKGTLVQRIFFPIPQVFITINVVGTLIRGCMDVIVSVHNFVILPWFVDLSNQQLPIRICTQIFMFIMSHLSHVMIIWAYVVISKFPNMFVSDKTCAVCLSLHIPSNVQWKNSVLCETLLRYIDNNVIINMYSRGELFMRSRKCCFGVYFPSCTATGEINTEITLEWAHKQFVTWVHTSYYFLHDITNP